MLCVKKIKIKIVDNKKRRESNQGEKSKVRRTTEKTKIPARFLINRKNTVKCHTWVFLLVFQAINKKVAQFAWYHPIHHNVQNVCDPCSATVRDTQKLWIYLALCSLPYRKACLRWIKKIKNKKQLLFSKFWVYTYTEMSKINLKFWEKKSESQDILRILHFFFAIPNLHRINLSLYLAILNYFHQGPQLQTAPGPHTSQLRSGWHPKPLEGAQWLGSPLAYLLFQMVDTNLPKG